MFGNIIFLNANKLVGFANYDNRKIRVKSYLPKKKYSVTRNYEVKKYFCWSQLKNYLLNLEHFLVLSESELTREL